MVHARRRPRRLFAVTLATLALVTLPAAALAKIDTAASSCTIAGGSASLTVAWKGRDPDNVLAQYDGGLGQVNDGYVLGATDRAANRLSMPLTSVPATGVTVRFQSSSNRVFDQASVACTGA